MSEANIVSVTGIVHAVDARSAPKLTLRVEGRLYKYRVSRDLLIACARRLFEDVTLQGVMIDPAGGPASFQPVSVVSETERHDGRAL